MGLGREEHISIHIKYKDLEQTFEGPTEEVWRAVNKFFGQLIPVFSLVEKAVITVDLAELVEELGGIVSLSGDRIIILANDRELSDKDVLMLGLLGAYVGYKIGALPKDTLSGSELRETLKKKAKVTSTRLGELRKSGWVEKTDEGEYRVTPLGIFKFREERLPRILTRLGRE